MNPFLFAIPLVFLASSPSALASSRQVLFLEALGGSVDVVELNGGTLTSTTDEDQADFLRRVAVVLSDFTHKTGFEACSMVWSNGDSWAVRLTTNRAHIGCVNTNLKPAGDWTQTKNGIHSHPEKPGYRVNAADSVFLGGMVPVATRSYTESKTFSPRDYHAGSGWLVAHGRLLYQNGNGTAQDLGLFPQS